MSKLSQEAIKNYIENGGYSCPFCGSGEIEAYNYDWDEAGAYSDVKCHTCGKVWTDVYKLVEITYDEDENE